MSMQRVFESARKLGVPIILTDPSGRDPMVILPLEQFEAMAGESHPVAPSQAPAVPLNKAPEPQRSPVMGLTPEEQKSFEALLMENPDIPVEERFYLEPVDDGSGA